MSKPIVYKTVICKVNGTTILDLNSDGTCDDSSEDISDAHKQMNNVIVTLDDRHMNGCDGDNDNDIEDVECDDDNEDMDEDYESMDEPINEPIGVRDAIRVQKVGNGIESVRQYVVTTRKTGKVWHSCQWKTSRGPCAYGSKWSGAMVNHIRSHLGIKPFGCGYCRKSFTIACNLKNHLRIHHGLKAKIILNGGRKRKFPVEKVVVTDELLDSDAKSSSKLRVFKPSFVNGKLANNAYAVERDVPKRTIKKVQRYGNFVEDLDDDDDDEYNEEAVNEDIDHHLNEEEAEEENRMFYEKTSDETEDNGEDDDLSSFLTKRRYNKKLWFVCIWNPKQCKYRSHQRHEVLAHLRKHQNIGQFVCNWNHCSASFTDKSQLISHQVIHKKQQPFRCNYRGCQFATINLKTLQMHKIRHKRCL